MLSTWLAAEVGVAKGQSYSIEGMSVTRADLRTIAERVKYWRTEVDRLLSSGGSTGPRVRRVIPRDL